MGLIRKSPKFIEVHFDSLELLRELIHIKEPATITVSGIIQAVAVKKIKEKVPDFQPEKVTGVKFKLENICIVRFYLQDDLL